MLKTLGVRDWQTLRAALRQHSPKGVIGSALRLIPDRRSKDGTFLDELAAEGLIEAAGPPTPPAPASALTPDPVPPAFRTRWRITALGKTAAEYGEYEVPGVLDLPTPAEFAAAKRAAER